MGRLAPMNLRAEPGLSLTCALGRHMCRWCRGCACDCHKDGPAPLIRAQLGVTVVTEAPAMVGHCAEAWSHAGQDPATWTGERHAPHEWTGSAGVPVQCPGWPVDEVEQGGGDGDAADRP